MTIQEYMQQPEVNLMQAYDAIKAKIQEQRQKVWDTADHSRQLIFYNKQTHEYAVSGLPKDHPFIHLFETSDLRVEMIEEYTRHGYTLLTRHNYLTLGL